MVRAKAGSGFALVQRELPARRERPPKPVLAVLVKEMAASARQQRRSGNWRGRPTAAELEMRSQRTRARIRKRRGIKPHARLSPEHKAVRATRRAKRKAASVDRPVASILPLRVLPVGEEWNDE